MKKPETMLVRDFIKKEIDIDVYDDVCEELGIAFCGPLFLTEEGKEHFAEVLDFEITIIYGYDFDNAVVSVDDIDDKVWKRKLRKAQEFFESAAGYCSESNFNKWIKDEE